MPLCMQSARHQDRQRTATVAGLIVAGSRHALSPSNASGGRLYSGKFLTSILPILDSDPVKPGYVRVAGDPTRTSKSAH
jgi:hypothetical protein